MCDLSINLTIHVAAAFLSFRSEGNGGEGLGDSKEERAEGGEGEANR